MIVLVVWTIVLAVAIFSSTLVGIHPELFKLASAAAIFSAAIIVHQLIYLIVWQMLVPHWTGNSVPKLLAQMTLMLLLVIAVSIIMVRVYEVPLSGVLTTSGLFIAIIGFALRNMISDLFTGIALGIERPFSVGDWIQVPDGTVGAVVEMNWRSTRLITREEITVVIPNSELAISTFKNFSKPERAWRDEFDILLHQSVSTHQAERILLSAVNQVPEIVAVGKPPEIRIDKYTENGIVWQVRFWVPDYQQMSRLRYDVQRAISRNMHYAGLTIPAEQVQVSEPVTSEDATFDLLRRVDLLRSLTDSEISQLQGSMSESLILEKNNVVVEGDHGDSLFIVKEGLMKVSIDGGSGSFVVAHLLPGSFFGEMSLFTGDPRGATVTAQVDSLVLEISKTSFEPIIRARSEIAELLSETIEVRNQHNDSENDRQLVDVDDGKPSVLSRIRDFFGLPVPETLNSQI